MACLSGVERYKTTEAKYCFPTHKYTEKCSFILQIFPLGQSRPNGALRAAWISSFATVRTQA